MGAVKEIQEKFWIKFKTQFTEFSYVSSSFVHIGYIGAGEEVSVEGGLPNSYWRGLLMIKIAVQV